ncbi:transcriptional regulator, HTH_3 family domain protein, partial [Vibrio cholerae CP1040(13)]
MPQCLVDRKFYNQ